jgi:hypothetical protein
MRWTASVSTEDTHNPSPASAITCGPNSVAISATTSLDSRSILVSVESR